tara:strand:- start:444 stop:1091 length:648 start_codon:yes stop_codon:yes gene_type:complete
LINDCEYTIHKEPWKYITSQGGLFTTEVYENLTNILYSEAVKDWTVCNGDGSDSSYPQATVVMIDEEAREKSTGFLREFYDWLWTRELDAKIHEATGVEFKRHSWMWHLDYPGFDQPWHNDFDSYPGKEITTFQVYMAKNNDKAHSGAMVTSICPEDDEDIDVRNLSNPTMAQYQVPYTPNQAWAFTASPETWHAVPTIDFYRPSFMCRDFKIIT